MSILVAFLVINKLSFSLGLYYELQGYLAKMNQAAVELTQLACSYTKQHATQAFKDWRFQIGYQTLLLLKTTVMVIFKGGQRCAWEIPELQDDPLVLVLDIRRGDYPSRGMDNHRGSSRVPKELYEFGHDLPSDRNLRVPIRIAQRLRDVITADRRALPVDPLDSIQERYLLDSVKDFMDGYYGIRNYLTCPLPLPLVQLGRIFFLFYVFTLPFALLSPGLNLAYPQMTTLIFLMTYGFIGIELLFVEIDDPFADDPNDLPLTEEARAAGEDVILNILRTDGAVAAKRLLNTVHVVKSFGQGDEPSESDALV